MVVLLSESVTWQQVDDEIVCLDLAASEYFSINAAGAVLWPQLLTGVEVGDLVATLVREFDLDVDAAEVDVNAFVSMLDRRGLLSRS